jgi:phospholipase A1/A2
VVPHPASRQRGTSSGYRRPSAEHDLLALRLRLWAPVDVAEENRDIERYYGYGEAGVVLNIERVVIGVSGRIGNRFDHGSVAVDLAYRPGESTVHLYLQGFTGYGESLVDYDRNDSNIRFGILALR